MNKQIRNQKVLELHQAGMGERTIAKTLGISRDTVRRIIMASRLEVQDGARKDKPAVLTAPPSEVGHLLEAWAEDGTTGLPGVDAAWGEDDETWAEALKNIKVLTRLLYANIIECIAGRHENDVAAVRKIIAPIVETFYEVT
jgi:hypothetical protein